MGDAQQRPKGSGYWDGDLRFDREEGSSGRNSDMTSSIQYDFMIAIRYRDDMGIDITMSISFYGDICTKPNGPLPAMP
jgi:hypothetical protein